MKIKFITIIFVIMSNINTIIGMTEEEKAQFQLLDALELSRQSRNEELKQNRERKQEFDRNLSRSLQESEQTYAIAESLRTYEIEDKQRKQDLEKNNKEQEKKKISDQNKLKKRLEKAIENNDFPELQNLVEKEKVDINDKQDYFLDTAILTSKLTIDDKLNIIKYLINNGADINLIDRQGFTSLMGAAHNVDLYNNHIVDDSRVPIFRYLVDQGAHLNILNIYGQTALHIATLYNNFLKVKYLVENGAKLNIKDNEGNTPLMLAFRKEHPDAHDYDQVIRYLIEQGADVNIVNNVGKSALDYPNIANVYKQFVQESIKPKIKQHLPTEISNIAADYC